MFKNNWTISFVVVVVQFLSHAQLFVTLQHARLPCPPSLALDQTHVHWLSDAIQPSHPPLPPFPAFNLSQHQGLFQWVSYSHRVAKTLALQHQVPPMNIQGWFIFRIDWFDLHAVQWTLKSLPQDHSTKASILQCSVFFIIQLSHLYMTTGKTTALTMWTSVGTVTSLLVFSSLFHFFYFIFSAPISFTVYVFQFLHLFWFFLQMFFLKSLSSVVEKIFVYVYINNMYNIYILENLWIFA